MLGQKSTSSPQNGFNSSSNTIWPRRTRRTRLSWLCMEGRMILRIISISRRRGVAHAVSWGCIEICCSTPHACVVPTPHGGKLGGKQRPISRPFAPSFATMQSPYNTQHTHAGCCSRVPTDSKKKPWGLHPRTPCGRSPGKVITYKIIFQRDTNL